MTNNEVLKLKRLIGHLRTAENMANELEIGLGNGGDVGSLIGSMADELDLQLANCGAPMSEYPKPSTIHYSAEAKEVGWKGRS